jgi:hypothetical protein
MGKVKFSAEARGESPHKLDAFMCLYLLDISRMVNPAPGMPWSHFIKHLIQKHKGSSLASRFHRQPEPSTLSSNLCFDEGETFFNRI